MKNNTYKVFLFFLIVTNDEGNALAFYSVSVYITTYTHNRLKDVQQLTTRNTQEDNDRPCVCVCVCVCVTCIYIEVDVSSSSSFSAETLRPDGRAFFFFSLFSLSLASLFIALVLF
jgi:hypothetical protein